MQYFPKIAEAISIILILPGIHGLGKSARITLLNPIHTGKRTILFLFQTSKVSRMSKHKYRHTKPIIHSWTYMSSSFYMQSQGLDIFLNVP